MLLTSVNGTAAGVVDLGQGGSLKCRQVIKTGNRLKSFVIRQKFVDRNKSGHDAG
jgi:hypothetical protein